MSSSAKRHRRARLHAAHPEVHPHAPTKLKVVHGQQAVAHPEVVSATPPAARHVPATMPMGKPPMVTTQPARRTNATTRALAAIGAGLLLALVGISAYHLRVGKPTQPMNDLFGRLERDYRIFGMEKYLEDKGALRMQVAHGLNEPSDSAAGKTARNIAAYLFPEMLPDENFEKAQAQEFWSPIERAIERAPKTDESRRWIEELRATLYDYEGVGRGAVRLSPYAETTLRLYEAMSEK